MRVAGLVLALCLAVVGSYATLAARPASTVETRNSVQPHWVRTRSGWQKATWTQRPEAYSPSLHPLVVASLMGFGSVIALLALPSQADR